MSRPRIKLPLPSRCAHCRLAVKAVRHNVNHTAIVVWVHDAPLLAVLRRGAAHEPCPDPAYQPQRARLVPVMSDDREPFAFRHRVRATVLA
jgi:hypothetical protein